MPGYIQGPKPYKKSSQSISLSREHEGLFFSEYGEGSSQHKFLEIYNPTNETIDLTGYAYPNSNNGASVDGVHDYWNTFADGASIAPGAVYIIADSDADSSIVALANELHEYLVMGTETDYELVDFIGTFTENDPGSGWDVAGVSSATANHTLVRKANVVAGNAGDWATSSGTNADDSEWIVYPSNTWDYLGTHEIEVEQEEDPVYLTEGFEGAFPPAGWSTSGDSISTFYYTGESFWQQGPADGVYGSPSSAFSGSYFAYFYDYGFSFSAVGDLITPSIDLSSAVAPILYFQYADGGGSDNVDVQVSNADGSFSSVFLTPTST